MEESASLEKLVFKLLLLKVTYFSIYIRQNVTLKYSNSETDFQCFPVGNVAVQFLFASINEASSGIISLGCELPVKQTPFT